VCGVAEHELSKSARWLGAETGETLAEAVAAFIKKFGVSAGGICASHFAQ
jgi:hypothetical protein